MWQKFGNLPHNLRDIKRLCDPLMGRGRSQEIKLDYRGGGVSLADSFAEGTSLQVL